MPRNTDGLLRRAGPGRPKGARNRVTLEVRSAARELLDDAAYRASLTRRLVQGKLAPAMESMLWHYAYGKPRELVEAEKPELTRVVHEVVFKERGGL